MARKLPEETRAKIKRLYEKGMKPKPISDSTRIPYNTVGNFLILLRSGFSRMIDYRNSLSKKNGHGSYASQLDFYSRESGWDSLKKQRSFYIQRLGFSESDYRNDLIDKRGFSSDREYKFHLAKSHGYDSIHDYKVSLGEKRRKKLKNRILSRFIRRRLEELGQNQRWLAERLGKKQNSISYYSSGESLPGKKVLDRIFRVLGEYPKGIDELIRY